MNSILERIKENPIIAAIRHEADMQQAVNTDVAAIFLLQADIFNISSLVATAKEKQKMVFVHMDFLEGIGKDHKAVEYLAKVVRPDGIISTKTNHISLAKEHGMYSIQRYFLIDSQSYEMMLKSVNSNHPDMIEVMPAVIANVLKRITAQLPCPVIAGGLVDDKNDIIQALANGALGVSTGKKDLWTL